MSMTKDDRLQIRVGPAEKSLLERAAAATHVSATDRSSSSVRKAAAAFTEALEAPATVNQRLATALAPASQVPLD